MGRHFIGLGGWFALMLFAVAAVFGMLWLQSGTTAQALSEHGIETVATVEATRTDTRHVRSKNGTRRDTDYFAIYAFEVQTEAGEEPEMLRVERRIPRWHYEELWRGKQVRVTYLPEDPTSLDVFPGQSRRDAGWHGWTAFGFALAGAVSGAFSLRAAQRTHRLEVSGVTVPAVVDTVRRQHSVWSLGLRFTDGQGVERKVTAPVSKAVGEAARQGATVSLRYDPADLSNTFVG